jgi:hypothetical protein
VDKNTYEHPKTTGRISPMKDLLRTEHLIRADVDLLLATSAEFAK